MREIFQTDEDRLSTGFLPSVGVYNCNQHSGENDDVVMSLISGAIFLCSGRASIALVTVVTFCII